MGKETTKVCPDCGDDKLVLINTQNLKLCTNCFDVIEGLPTQIPWYKDANQPDYR
jgi:hypothetical protein